MNKSILILAILLALTACSGENEHGHSHGDETGHDHQAGSSHKPHDDHAPETKAYYGDEANDEPQANASETGTDNGHTHDPDSEHSH